MNYRIFHIEDDPTVSVMTENILKKSLYDKGNFNYVCSEYLEDGLAQIKDNKFDIVIVDLTLKDGFECDSIKMIKDIDQELPIIVLTSDDRLESAKKCVHMGASSYILKENIKTLPLIIILTIEKCSLKKESKIINDRYKSIVESSPDWILRFLPNGSITFINSSAFNGLNLTENIIGKNICEFISSNQYECYLDILQNISKETPEVSGYEMWINNRLIQWRESGIFDSNGALTELQVVGRDMTDQYRTIQSLKNDTKNLITKTTEHADKILDNAMKNLQEVSKMLDK